MERAISSVNVDDTTNVWNHVRTRNLSIKSTWMPRPRIIIRAIEKYRGGRGGGVGGSCRQYRRCKYLTKIRRRLSFSPALLVPRVSTAVRSRKSVRCLRNYLPPRSFDDSIGNFRRMKGAFPFSIFFFPPSLFVLFPPCSPSLLFSFSCRERLGIGSAKSFEKSIAATCVDFSTEQIYIDAAILIALLFPRVEWRNLDVNK